MAKIKTAKQSMTMSSRVSRQKAPESRALRRGIAPSFFGHTWHAPGRVFRASFAGLRTPEPAKLARHPASACLIGLGGRPQGTSGGGDGRLAGNGDDGLQATDDGRREHWPTGTSDYRGKMGLFLRTRSLRRTETPLSFLASLCGSWRTPRLAADGNGKK